MLNVDIKSELFKNLCPHHLKEVIIVGAFIIIGIKENRNKEKEEKIG